MSRLPLLVTCALALAPAGRAAEFETAVVPAEGEQFKTAAYRVWLPDGLKTVRAVIVRQHGCGRDGIGHADDLQFRALAAKHGAALLGTHLTDGGDCADWFDPQNGSGRAFLAALDRLAAASGHPELATAPWAIWGHSGGAIWACHMLNQYPARVVGVWARSQAVTASGPAARGVPVVYNYGVREAADPEFAGAVTASVKAFETGRPNGAVWALAADPKSGHDCRDGRALAVRFFDWALGERLPKAGVTLNPVADTAAAGRWRGVRQPPSIQGPFSSVGRPGECVWLPTERYAKAWLEYAKTGTVTDATPPPAPTGVTAEAGPGGVVVAWRAVADIETGVKAFVVLRDGVRIGTVGGAEPGADFQGVDYGDEPLPRSPAMRFVDPAGRVTDRYTVVQVNKAGLESK